jgi:hypothetical protein
MKRLLVVPVLAAVLASSSPSRADEAKQAPSSTAAWVTIGAGATAIVVGGTMFAVGASNFYARREDIQSEYAARTCTSGSRDPACVQLEDDFNRNRDGSVGVQVAGAVIAGLGLGAVIVGLHLFPSKAAPASMDVALVPSATRDGGGAALVGHF